MPVRVMKPPAMIMWIMSNGTADEPVSRSHNHQPTSRWKKLAHAIGPHSQNAMEISPRPCIFFVVMSLYVIERPVSKQLGAQ